MIENALQLDATQILIRVSILLLALLLAHLLLRRASAAASHLTQILGLVAALSLPLVAVAVPGWDLPLLPGRENQASPVGETTLGAFPSHEALIAQKKATPLSAERPAAAPGAVSPAATAPAVPTAVEGKSAATPSTSGPRTGGTLALWISLAWAAGCGALLVRFGIGWSRMSRLVSNATPLQDARIWRILSECRDQLGLRDWPPVLTSPRLRVPLIWGALRPSVVLPDDVAGWTDDRLRMVLLHELGHVRRRDGLSLIVGRIATAIYWFHPLAWFVDRNARADCERACDDLVLSSGARPSDYAEHLLAIVRRLPATRLPEPQAAALLRPHGLEARLRSILVPARHRRIHARGAIALSGMILLAMLVLGSVRVVARDAQPESLPTQSPAAGPTLTEQGHGTLLAGGIRKVHDKILLAHGGHGHENHAGAEAYDRAMDLHNEEQFEAAIESFEEAAAEGYRVGTATYNAACGQARLGRSADAVATLERAFEAGFDRYDLVFEDSDLDPIRGDASFRKLLDDVRADAGVGRWVVDRRELAMDEFSDLTEEGSTDGHAWYRVGTDLLSLREFDSSVDALSRAAELLGDRGHDAHYNLACAHSLAGDTGQALDSLEQAVLAGFDSKERFQNDSDLDAIRGSSRFTEIEAMHDALSMNMDGGNGSDSFYSSRRWEQRIAGLSDFTQSHPDVGRGWFSLGYAQHYAGNHQDAIASFDKALDLGFRRGTTSYNIACAQALSGASDAALDWLGRALDAGFTSVGHMAQDKDLKSLHDDPRFEEILERAAELNPDEAPGFWNKWHRKLERFHFKSEDENRS